MNQLPAPAGWYPDPANHAFFLRWWDGQQWTSHVVARAPEPARTTDRADSLPRVIARAQWHVVVRVCKSRMLCAASVVIAAGLFYSGARPLALVSLWVAFSIVGVRALAGEGRRSAAGLLLSVLLAYGWAVGIVIALQLVFAAVSVAVLVGGVLVLLALLFFGWLPVAIWLLVRKPKVRLDRYDVVWAQWRNDDPGETRPYKTRPVVIVDVLADGSVAALMCTTKGAGRAGFVEIPTGGWDSNQQRSWLNTRSGRCVQPHQLNNRLGVLPQDWQSWFDQVAGQATYAEPN